MSDSRQLNGLDLDRLDATLTEARVAPEGAWIRLRARNCWMGGTLNRTTLPAPIVGGTSAPPRRTAFVVDADQGEALGGHDRSAGPAETLLHSLVACLTTALVYHATNLGIEVHAVETLLDGDMDLRGFLGLDAGARSAFRRVRVRFRVDAEGGSEVARHLVQIAKQRSPVFDMLSGGIKVDVALEPATAVPAGS